MKPKIRRISLTLVFTLVSMWLLIFFLPLPPLLAEASYSRAVYDVHHQLLRLTLSKDGKYRLFTPLTAISPYVVKATLLQEDQYFRWHPGVNPVSLLKAGLHTYWFGPRRLGASTITMQVARMRYGIHSKTFSGKLWQILRALQLELHFSKNQILEAYFNLAPYGNNIEGLGAASLIYFGKPVRELALPEALTLVVIPQNPNKRVPERGKLEKIRQQLFARWIKINPDDDKQQPLMDLPLVMRNIHAIPFLAPHFVNQVLADTTLKFNEINTTLDMRLQKTIEVVTQHYLARKKNLGVNNAAVLLIDARDMSVKALLGSANFFDASIGGQINGTAIRRSPGSTLKPFIYALALQQGLIHPATVLKDVPHSFGSYNPENFDNDFMGPISAKDALVLSRNIPAIYLADQLTRPTLYDFLQQAEVTHLKSASYYGLALVLGGAELSMQELVTLYATLANDGLWQPLHFASLAKQYRQKRLLSSEATFLVLDMLRDASHGIPVAWKTGTSSGYRDAWTVGIIGPYVMAVWIGDFDNQGNPAFIGKKIAAPLFFEITHALNTYVTNIAMPPVSPLHMNLTQVDVCKASGMLPTRHCPETEKVWFIPGVSPIQTDTIFREIAINSRTGLRACRFDKDTKFVVYEFWSSDLLKIFKRAGIARRSPPAYDKDCALLTHADMGFAPQIISPQKQVNYIARLAAIKETVIPLSAVVDADVKTIYWFVNNEFLGKTTRDKAFLWHATPGKHVLRMVDDYGRSDVREVVVKMEG